jgi:hypothetical protein
LASFFCRRLLAFSAQAAFLCAAVSPLLAAGPAEPLNVARFSSDSKALYSAASESVPPDGTDAAVLDDDENYVFDGYGHSVHTQYMVFKVLTQKGAEGWDSVSVSWEPWHEQRPTIRARVVTPDYIVHELDSKTITDAPARQDESDLYSDRRTLRAPLPAIAPGSVVEEEFVTQDDAPLFGAGTVQRVFFGSVSAPVQHSHLALEGPTSFSFPYTLQLLPDLKPQRTETDGRVKKSILIAAQPPPSIVLKPTCRAMFLRIRQSHFPLEFPGRRWRENITRLWIVTSAART